LIGKGNNALKGIVIKYNKIRGIEIIAYELININRKKIEKEI
jgi:hypothetical protein